jgi:hypothetical protein
MYNLRVCFIGEAAAIQTALIKIRIMYITAGYFRRKEAP